MGDFPHSSDIELERLAAAGDQQAFGVLYERYVDHVHDFLMRSLRNEAEAADLTQDTFVRAFRAMDRDRVGAASFRSWLFTIANNLFINHSKKRSRTETTLDDVNESPSFAAVDRSRLADPEKAAAVDEVSALVWQAVEVLEPRQQSVIQLHLRHGLESSEIATVLNVKPGTAYTVVSRAKDAFESAFAALVMLKAGRRNCPALDNMLAEHDERYTVAIKRLIDRHVSKCELCQEEKKRRLSPSAILPALALLALPLALRRRSVEAAWEEICAERSTPMSASGASVSGAGMRGLGLSSPRAPIIQNFAIGGLVVAALIVAGSCIVPRLDGFGGDGNLAVVADASTPDLQLTSAPIRSPMPTPLMTSGATGTAPTATNTGVGASGAPSVPPVDPSPAPIPSVAPTEPTDVPSSGSLVGACGAPASRGTPTVDSSLMQDFMAVTNNHRASKGQPALLIHPALTAAAESYARFNAEVGWYKAPPPDQVREGVLVKGIHIAGDCSDMLDRALSFGYPPAPVGENVVDAVGAVTGQQLLDEILSSGAEDPARVGPDGQPLFQYVGAACYQQTNITPAEVVCVQVLGSS